MARNATSRGTDDVPSERSIPIDGGSLHLRSVGDPGAETIVLIHGGPGISSRYMRGLESLAGSGRQVVSYDQRGIDRSTFDSDDPAAYDLDAQSSDLGHVIDAVTSGPVHLLGHSWGGIIAMDYASRCPDRVTSLLLIDSCPPHIRDLEPGYAHFGARVEDFAERGLIRAHTPGDATDELRAMMPVYLSDPSMRLPPTVVDAFQVYPKAGALTAEVLPTLDLLDGVARYPGRVLTLMGADDPFGTDWATATHAAFTGASESRLVILERTGHIGWIESPEPFFGAVESFLDLTTG